MEKLRFNWGNLAKFELLILDPFGLTIVEGLGIAGETDEWGKIWPNGAMCV